jgi:hypothetical protein
MANTGMARGTADLMALLSGQDTAYGLGPAENIASQLTSFVPGAGARQWRSIDNALNGPKVFPKGAVETFQNGIAFWSPRGHAVTLLGDTVAETRTLASRVYGLVVPVVSLKDDKTMQFVVKHKMPVPVAGMTRDASGQRITPKQFEKYMGIAGKEMRKWLESGGMDLVMAKKDVRAKEDGKTERELYLADEWEKIRDKVLATDRHK